MRKQQHDMEKNVQSNGVIAEGVLGQVIHVEYERPDGSRFVGQDFQFCPTMAEQHSAHLTDLNYLIAKYKPDELAAYIAARSQYRNEIIGHDFSREPNLQEARNVVLESRREFEKLPEDIQNNFKNHLEFLKFIDNPANAEKMVKLGLMTKKQIEKVAIPDNPNQVTPPTPNDKPNDEKAK